MDVEVVDLTKTFGSLRANDSISLRFAAGQIHGVLGENGAGKSTLMKLLSGFLRRDSGEVRLDAHPAKLDSPAAALRAGVGMVHQDPMDVPAFTALENFFCASPRAALPRRAVARRRLVELGAHLGFALEPDAPVAGLTVGQRQQLEITRLLACGARVLILDEPTTGITAAQARALFAALRRLADEGNTVLFVSHKLDEVAELCHTVSVLRAGRVAGPGQLMMPQPQQHLLGLMFGAAVADQRQSGDPPQRGAQRAEPVWQVERAVVREGELELRGLTLALAAGRVVGLAGLEGSGQRLLLRLLAGRLRPQVGRLLVAGRDMTGQPPERFRRAGVEYLPADRLVEGVVGEMSLAEHMALLRPTPGVLVDRSMARTQAVKAIADYGIKATPDTPLAALSGGNQQRAMLALLPPRCQGLLLEQPTRGLDVASARAVWARLLARRDDGAAVVFASADLDEILDYSDDVLVFFAGRVSPLLPRATLSAARLAELIGGVGFAEGDPPKTAGGREA